MLTRYNPCHFLQEAVAETCKDDSNPDNTKCEQLRKDYIKCQERQKLLRQMTKISCTEQYYAKSKTI